ncbi:MAG: hypothetical protein JO057_18300 [Chloroflexi bacterium]|nr:hypothetical protein [Chloroflexota bacterium]
MSVATNGSDPASLTVTLTFLAIPVWDPNRTAAAAAGPLLTSFGIPKLASLAILPASATQLLLNMPSTNPSVSSAPVPIANATIDTANGIQGSVTLSLAQFQQVYNAMFVTPSVLLSGELQVTVDQSTEHVPFTGRASDFAGEIFDLSQTYDQASNQVSVVAKNAIESPIHVAALPVLLLQNGTSVPYDLVGVSPDLPVDLQPGGSGTDAAGVSLVLQLAAGRTFDPSTKAQLDMGQVTVRPDSAAIWKAIIQNQVTEPVKRQITVQLPAAVFGAQAGGASASDATTPPLAVQVVFQNGQTVTFESSPTATGGLLTQTIELNVDVAQYVLGQGDSSSYTYRVDTITASGTQSGQWTTTNVDDLFVTMGG